MKLGIIQTRGLGDIVIAAPIAMYYVARGCEIFWPIDSNFIPSFSEAFPKIKFIPVDQSMTGHATSDYFYHKPLEELNIIGCDSIICLYSHLTGFDLGNHRMQESLSFDAYKYAIAGVPLKEKWNLKINRNTLREANIFKLLDLDPKEEYIVVHDEGSNIKLNIDKFITENKLRVIKIKSITDNIFDWLGVIESAQTLHLIDSVYANLVEQLNIQTPKTLYLRSKVQFSPIFINSWSFS